MYAGGSEAGWRRALCKNSNIKGASFFCACWGWLEVPAAPHLRWSGGSTPELGIRRRPLSPPAATCSAGLHALAQNQRWCCLPALQLASEAAWAARSTRGHVMLHGRHFCRLSALARVPVICK